MHPQNAWVRRAGRALAALRQNERGAIGIIAGLAMPVLVGAAVLGAEGGLLAYKHQSMQGAADSAALTGVISKTTGATLIAQGRAVAAAQGYVNGVAGVSVILNAPPLTGAYAGKSGAVEAIVAQPQQPTLARFFSANAIQVRARAVAIQNPGGACMLALNASKSGAVTVQGSSVVTLTGCDAFSNSADSSAIVAGGSSRLSVASASAVGGIPNTSNITATNGVFGGASPAADPYADQNFQSFGACSQTYSGGSATLSPGVYCGGISLSAGATVNLLPGTYYLDSSDLKVAGNATLTGSGVTLVFTSSKGKDYGTASISSNAIINLSAPTSGPTQGIILFGDRNMPVGAAFKITGGGTQNWTGAIYLPKADLTYAGGASGGAGCTQIVADTVTFTGNSNLSLACDGSGVTPMGNRVAVLVE